MDEKTDGGLMSRRGQVLGTVEHGIGWITLANPDRLNAISYSMWQELVGLLDRFDSDPGVRCLVVCGEGERAFCVGADISEFGTIRSGSEDNAGYESVSTTAMARLQSVRKPTIAMIRGYCLGGGLAVALCCDLRLADESSLFSIPAAKLGLGYNYDGIKRLVSIVGPSNAKRIFFTASRFGTAEALKIGLVDSLHAKADLEGAVTALTDTIAANAPMTITAAKYAIDTATLDHADQNMDECRRLAQACFDSEDFAEGRRAFAEKRSPKFTGR
jgi:enoyl-CoA hydratase